MAKLARGKEDYWYQETNAKTIVLQGVESKRLGRKANIYGASLPAGYSCPMAVECMTKVDEFTGKLTDGELQTFRCHMATMEAMSPTMRRLVWHNFRLLRKAKTREAMLEVLDRSFPVDADVMRPGLDGDFFNQAHFAAWMDIARRHPSVRFYAYTKSAGYWEYHLDTEGIPDNVELNSSEGGRQDNIARARSFKTAKVVLHPEEADALGLEIDHDESHAINPGPSFALLIHGTQPKGSKQSAALKRMRAEGIQYAYSSKK
jgi:hypothetical protein